MGLLGTWEQGRSILLRGMVLRGPFQGVLGELEHRRENEMSQLDTDSVRELWILPGQAGTGPVAEHPAAKLELMPERTHTTHTCVLNRQRLPRACSPEREELSEMKTTTIDAINAEGIPEALRDQRSWVVWRTERQKGRAVKPPFTPRTGRKASCSDPSTWGTFDEALVALAEGFYDGIGIQLTPPFVGVDLDGCRHPETGFIDEGAMAIIEQLDSYTEVSPSGRGIHILTEGQLPPEGRRTQGVEIYDRRRYFTVTGQHLAGTPLTVESRSVELAALHRQLFGSPSPVPRTTGPEGSSKKTHTSVSLADEALVDKMKDAGNGELFDRLWRGEWEGKYRSPSDADAALCCILAFWTGRDAERMDRLFRQSGLYRSKWDERRGSRTYGDMTIAQARGRTYGVWTPSGDQGGRGEVTT